MLHDVSSEKSQIGRHRQHAFCRLKKAVAAKQDNSTRQSHKGRLERKYSELIIEEKMASKYNVMIQNIVVHMPVPITVMLSSNLTVNPIRKGRV